MEKKKTVCIGNVSSCEKFSTGTEERFENMENKNIAIVGVGGQGTLLASRLMGQLFLNAGYDVKVSEVHGMSQRGGSVITYVRCGQSVASPIIDAGEADYVVSFELLEGARYLRLLKEDGKLVCNSQKMDPMPVVTGAMNYPENLEQKMADLGINTDIFDALTLAEEAGTSRAVNMVLMGRLSRYFDLPEEAWLEALDAVVPPKTIEINRKAFALGRN